MRKFRITKFLIALIAFFAIAVSFFPSAIKNMHLGLDLQGGFEIVYQVKPLTADEKILNMNAVVAAVRNRVDILGVAEPSIAIEGEDRIRIQLAGVKDIEEARKMISSTANLSFRDINDKLLMDANSLVEGGASLGFDSGRPVVSLKIKDKAKFAQVTKTVAAMPAGTNLIVTWLDFEEGKNSYKAQDAKNRNYISAASVNHEINGDAIISGNFTTDEAKSLANLINAGSLPVKMTEIYSNVVSPELGADSFHKTFIAGAIGVIAVMLFMIFAYGLMGLISAVTLAFYTFFVIFVQNLMGGVFTLSGIAALVLGVGMTIDASVITFERIKDNIYAGRSVRQSVKEGSRQSLSAIFDSQLTTLISAIILYALGTGSVKGFATILLVTVLATFLINVVLVRFLLNLLVKTGLVDNRKHLLGVKAKYIPNLELGEHRKYFGPLANFDFMKNAKYFIFTSVGIILLGAVMMVYRVATNQPFLNLGVDFASGTKISFEVEQKIDGATLDAIFTKNNLDANRVVYGGNNHNKVSITFNKSLDQDQLTAIKKDIKDNFHIEANSNSVTPVVGRELVKTAALISLLAWIAILIYISIRYKWDYAISGILTLIHDVAFVIAIFSIFFLEINIEFIAVILAIIGYSIDDTIVIFDRIRETIKNIGSEYRIKPKEYYSIMNNALKDVSMRSLINTFTTVLPVFFLIVLGSSAIFNFNIGMLVGLMAGAYSSIFISVQLLYFFRMKFPPKMKVKKKSNQPEEMTVFGIND